MIKNNIIAIIIAVAVVTIPVVPVVYAAPDTGDSTSSAAPSTGDSTSSATSAAPSTGDSTSSAGSTAPSTGDSTSSAGSGDTSTPTEEPRRSSGGSRRSTNRNVATTPVVTPVIGTCPLITDLLKLGGANNTSQVTKLQSFLKNVEKLDLEVTGTFDVKTEDAVKAFQKKYSASILGPWGATRATGVVYITTMKKINEIACATPFALSANDLATIEAYKNRGETVVGQSTEVGQTGAGTSTDVGTTKDTDKDENTDVAAVGEASVMSRFWAFVKNLFR